MDNRPPRRRFSSRPDRGRGRGQGPRAKKPPMLLGEPSPSLAKIRTMNMEKLRAKIESLDEEKARIERRINGLLRVDTAPADQIQQLRDLLKRLEALQEAARERLEHKQQRKEAWERRQQLEGE